MNIINRSLAQKKPLLMVCRCWQLVKKMLSRLTSSVIRPISNGSTRICYRGLANGNGPTGVVMMNMGGPADPKDTCTCAQPIISHPFHLPPNDMAMLMLMLCLLLW
jgi:gamma-glutamyl-gamma-aminobutyrate hydrolase PuuD